MDDVNHRELVETVIEENRYLALSTTDGTNPWVAPVEYIWSEGAFYFFSTTTARHSEHVEENDTVGVAIWSPEQPAEYSPDLTTTLNGVQIRGTVTKVPNDECPPTVAGAAEELESVMPPYATYRIDPERMYAPVVEDGVNKRIEVDMG